MAPVLRRFLFLPAILAASSLQAATYTIEALPETKQAKVTIVLNPGGSSTQFRMPAWAPGDYQILNYGTKIEQLKFRQGREWVDGVEGDDLNLWTIEGGASEVTYVVNESHGNFSPNLRVTDAEMFVSGPGVLGWFAGHADEKHDLRIKVTPIGASVACSLDPGGSVAPYQGYVAEDYDELIDSPFVVGTTVRVHQFVVEGKPHAIIGYNQSAGVNLAAFEDNATKIAIEAKKIFGELPYDRYYYFFDFGGPGGGLEHLDSTKIGLSPRASAASALGIMSHEYFHTFNVKRIRSKPLGPFDYTKPAVTGAIWWLEGVTDYYADVITTRAGLESRQDFLRSMTGTFNSLHRGNAYMRTSADESSRRVWEARGSQGFGGISYYTKGKAVGFALDLAIRAESGNRHSLDDVIRDLYNETKGPSGFEEGRIRELCIKYGGERLGGLYDVCVMQAVRIPIEGLLSAAGLAMVDGAIVDDPNATQVSSSLAKAYPYQTMRW